MGPHSTFAAAATQAVATADHVSVIPLLGRLVVSLLIVLFLLWGLAQLLRRRGRIIGRGPGASRRMQQIDVMSRQSLGKGQSLVTVRTEDRVLLLGVTAQSITALSELPIGDDLLDSGDVVEARSLPVGSGSELTSGAKGSSVGLSAAALGATLASSLGFGGRRNARSASTSTASTSTASTSTAWSDRLDHLRSLTVRK